MRVRSIAISLLMVLACGCVTGVKGSPRRACYDSGMQPGSTEFENCWRRVAHSQGTVVYDDPEAVALIGSAIAARNATSTAKVGAGTTSIAISVQQIPSAPFFARKLSKDLYALGRQFVVQTRYCYAFANNTPARVIAGTAFFGEDKTGCTVVAAWRTEG